MAVDLKLPVKIELPFAIMSGNKLDRMHWAAKRRYEAKVYAGLLWTLPDQSKRPTTKRILTITCYRRKLLDEDNYRKGCKRLVDIIVKKNFFKDDSPEWIKVYLFQERISHNPKDQPRTVISIHEYSESLARAKALAESGLSG